MSKRLLLGIFIASCGGREDFRSDAGIPSDGSLLDGRMIECPVQRELARTSGGLDQLLLFGGMIYFHDDQGLWHVGKDGQHLTLVQKVRSTEWPRLNVFLVDSSDISWVEGDPDAEFKQMPRGGGVVTSTPIGRNFNHVIAGPSEGLPQYQMWQSSGHELVVWFRGGTIFERHEVPTDSSRCSAFGALCASTSGGVLAQQIGTPLRVLASQPAFGVTTAQGRDLVARMFFTQFQVGDEPTTVWRLTFGQPNGVLGWGSAEMVFPAAKQRLGSIENIPRWDGTSWTDAIFFCNRTQGTVTRFDPEVGEPVVVGSDPTTEAIDVAGSDNCIYWTAVDKDHKAGHIYVAPR